MVSMVRFRVSFSEKIEGVSNNEYSNDECALEKTVLLQFHFSTLFIAIDNEFVFSLDGNQYY